MHHANLIINRPNALDPERKLCLLHRELEIPAPTVAEREYYLKGFLIVVYKRCGSGLDHALA